jgi:type I restriction enzyme S subunit
LDLSDLKFVQLPKDSNEGKRTSLKFGDILISITAELGKLGWISEGLGTAYINQHTALVRMKDSVDSKFVAYSLSTEKYNNKLNSLNDSGAKAGLNLGTIRNFELIVPPKAEQTKIASFLSNVDEKISQLTQKHQLLSQYKQGMMQKLFSQQIRFKADDGSEFGEWEDKTIEQIANFRRGSFPQPYGLPEWLDSNGFPFVQVYDVSDKMLLKERTKIKISQLAADQSVFAKQGTLIITIQGSIGRIAKMQYDAYVDRTLLIFQSYNCEVDVDYFKYALFLLFNIEKERAEGAIIKTITKETLSKFIVQLPCLEEQTKIANFLSAIDQKIEVVAQQIEQAKTWKKGLLQQMFV